MKNVATNNHSVNNTLISNFHPHLQMNTGQMNSSRHAVALRARASSVSQDGVNLNRVQDGITRGTYRAAGNLGFTMMNGEQWLRQVSDLAVTVSGVCLCTLWITLLYHLL